MVQQHLLFSKMFVGPEEEQEQVQMKGNFHKSQTTITLDIFE